MENKHNLVNFDQNHIMTYYCDYLKKKILVIINDELEASEESLTDEYKGRIVSFLDDMVKWYSSVSDAVMRWATDTYHIHISPENLELMVINVLFEQFDKELYGVSFRLSNDVEHGCGVQIAVQNNNYTVVKIGTEDVALSLI